MQFRAEFTKYTAADLARNAKMFDNKEDDYAELAIIDNFAMFFPDGKTQKPIFYFRHSNVDSTRFGGFIHPGDGPLNYQTSAHHRDIAQADTPFKAYGELPGEAGVFGFSAKEPYCEFRYTENGAVWKEGKDGAVLNVKAIPFPYTFSVHRCDAITYSPWVSQPCFIRGTYEGREIEGIGAFERVFKPRQIRGDYASSFAYIGGTMYGVRADGRTEAAFFNITVGEKPSSIGYYWLEGEPPVLSDNIVFEADWYHLPYTDDKTCVYKDAVIKIGERTIHFCGKWGTKGFTEKPRIERHGQSQILGTWYEGETPYEHRMFFTFNENMEAYEDKLKKLGFRVVY